MNPLARSETLCRLFETNIGDALCHHFRSYWKAEVMTEYLHRAVKFTQTGQTTLNITDSIHSIMKSHFLDFVVYMVDYMNDNYNLDIFFSSNSTEVKKLFSDLTRCLPIPQKLSKLKILSSIQHESKYRKTVIGHYQFPFFRLISPRIVDIVKEVALRLRQSGDLHDAGGPLLPDPRVRDQLVFGFEKQLQRQVEECLIQMKEQQGCTAAALSAIDKHKELWDRYFHDFTRDQLSLWLHNKQIVEDTLEAAFGTVCVPLTSNISQLTSLHVYTYLNQQNISTNVAALGSFLKLSSISEHVSGRLRSFSSASEVLLKTEDTNTFVLNTLFNTLLTASGKDQVSIVNIKLWYSAYHTMIHAPAIRKRIYSSLSETSEAKLNIMHAAFLAIQYDPSDNGLLMKCKNMVNDLCNRRFTGPSFEVSSSKLLLLSWLLKESSLIPTWDQKRTLPMFRLNASVIVRAQMMTYAFSQNIGKVFPILRWYQRALFLVSCSLVMHNE